MTQAIAILLVKSSMKNDYQLFWLFCNSASLAVSDFVSNDFKEELVYHNFMILQSMQNLEQFYSRIP